MLLYTIGYQERSFEEMLYLLTSHQVGTVADVRQNAFSYRPAFSKHNLAMALQQRDFSYQHYRNLGTPRYLRDEYKVTRDWSRVVDGFRRYLATQRQEIERLEQIVTQDTICLLCYERDPHSCHRFIVAERLQEDIHGLEVVHL